MLKKALFVLLSLLLISALVVGCGQTEDQEQPSGTSGEESAEKVELRVVTAFPENSVEHDGFWMFIDEVKKQLGDRVEIKYLGGPEVIEGFDQYEMLAKGMFEIGHLPGNYAENKLPIANTLHLSRLNPTEERQEGVYDILREQFEEKMDLVYLGKTAGPGYLYQLYTNFEVDSLEDFKGKSIRVAPVYVPLVKALGASPVSMGAGDIYTAMERGTVDGFGWPSLGIKDFGWAEVTKYRIDPGFYPVGLGVFFNKDTWDKLPEDVQTKLEDIMAETEKKVFQEYGKYVEEETSYIQDEGMEIIELSAEDAEKYVNTAFEKAWEQVIEKDAEFGPQLKEMTTP